MRIIKDFVLREIAGTYVLIAVGQTTQEFNGTITINDTAAYIWQHLEKAKSFDDLVKMMADVYDVPIDRLAYDIYLTLNELKKRNIIDYTDANKKW